MSQHGKPEFHEAHQSDRVDPLYVGTVDFDYEAADGNEDAAATAAAERAEIVTKLFAFVTKVRLGNDIASRQIGRRFAALAWVLNPGLFEGSPSATKLAKLLGINSSPEFLKLTGEVRREFGISNRGQAHAWNAGKGKAQSEHPLERTRKALPESKSLISNPRAPGTPAKTPPTP